VFLTANGGQWANLFFQVFLIYLFFAACIFFVFIPSPASVGIAIKESEDHALSTTNDDDDEAISIWQALRLPRVLTYSFCFFCIKFTIYSLVNWMPTFIGQALYGSSTQAANIQSFYEVGAALGSIVLGYCTDLFYQRRSPVIMFSVFTAACISVFITVNYSSFSTQAWLIIMFSLGFFVGNVNTFLVMTCPQDLGKAQGKRAIATITGIVDGIGSAGSGIGQLILGFTVEAYGWQLGYLLQISLSLVACLIPIAFISCQEIQEYN